MQDESAGESIETDRQQKKELSFFIISRECLVLTFLTHPGDQELFLGKLGIESSTFQLQVTQICCFIFGIRSGNTRKAGLIGILDVSGIGNL